MTKVGVHREKVIRVPRDKVKAEFHFICKDPASLTCEVAKQTVEAGFEVAGATNADQELYTQYIAFIEDNGSPKDTGEPLRTIRSPLPGSCYRTQVEVVVETLETKHFHEVQHLREPGHVSTHAPDFLTHQTCVLVIGSRRFLNYNVWVYLERYGLLRKRLIEMMVSISDLEQNKAGKIKKNYVYCPVRDEKFYPGNFNALLANIKRGRKWSTQEVFERIEGA